MMVRYLKLRCPSICLLSNLGKLSDNSEGCANLIDCFSKPNDDVFKLGYVVSKNVHEAKPVVGGGGIHYDWASILIDLVVFDSISFSAGRFLDCM